MIRISGLSADLSLPPFPYAFLIFRVLKWLVVCRSARESELN
jgi:hypothetical protein